MRWTIGIALGAVIPPVVGGSGSAFCSIGDCINCFYCDGDCYSHCMCFSDYNTCCCSAPPGHYSRGYRKESCPAGTYQDFLGQGECKACNSSDARYDKRIRGAVDHVDCERALCQNT